MQNLPLQIGQIDVVKIDQSDGADSGRGEIKRGGRPEAARADAQDARRFQSALSLDRDLRHDEMARVTSDFLVAQLRLRAALLVDDAFRHVVEDNTKNCRGACAKRLLFRFGA